MSYRVASALLSNCSGSTSRNRLLTRMDIYDAQSFVDEFRGGIALYRRLLDQHVYPPFTNPERSAMEETTRVFADYMNGPYIEGEDVDQAVYAERAEARGLAKYDELFAMQTILMNLFG